MKKSTELYILIFLTLIYCNPFASRNKPLNLEPTIIKYPRNELGILYYSKYDYSYETVIKNFEDLFLHYPDQIANRIAPKYPIELYEEKKLDTTVVAKIHIDKNGQVESIIILNSCGDYLDNNSIDAIKNWVFESLKESSYFLEIPMRFKHE